MPKSLEAYYQEAGRAGRDGERADCILLFSAGDITTAKFLIQNCGNCKSTYEMKEITIPAQMILSCMKRVQNQLGYCVGATLIVQILHGSTEKRVLELELDQLSTYGLMRNISRLQIREYIEFLELEEYISTNPRHGSLELTKKSADVLFHGKRLEMPVIIPASVKNAAGKKKQNPRQSARDAFVNEDNELFHILKTVRTRLAQEEGAPAYIIFSNASLKDMASKQPRTMAEFMEISGVGEIKASRYGEAFMHAILKYEE